MYNAFTPSQFSKTNEIVLVPWHSKEGIRRLERSKHKGSFYQLAHHFQPQINPLYCGVATSVIVLNALHAPKGTIPSQKPFEVKLPQVWGGEVLTYESYTQATLLNAETDKVKAKEIIQLKNAKGKDVNPRDLDPGLSLASLKGILEVYSLTVEIRHADQRPATGIKTFRKTVMQVLNEIGRFVIVNFRGESLGAPTGGHISPLAAYDLKSDSILILDVYGVENSWYWAPVEHLYKAMATLDNNVHRGWLVVSD
ncbi:MAG: phytochelatin synthase family protein [Chloroflexota bacterium]